VNYGDPAVLNILRQSHHGIYREGVDNDMYTGLISQLFGRRNGGRGSIRQFGFFNEQNLPDQRYIWGLWETQSRARPGSTAFDPLAYVRDQLVPYSDYVYDTFLGIPDTVPQRVRDLAAQITAQADNDYDRAKAIEAYLVKIPYTLTPGPTPDGQDFVDYFLFDGREGYCTYYASAMAVLCRSIGLPARYIEGYIMPPEASQDGIYDVTNLQAHAWVEVYFEGFGWVPFEPTAPYSYSYYQITPPPDTHIFASDFISNPEYEQYMQSMMGGMVSIPLPMNSNPGTADAPAEKKADYLAGLLYTAALLLFLCACFGVLVLRAKFSIWRRQRYIRRLPRNQQVVEYFHDIIKMTRYYRYPMRENETPSVYANRIGKRFAFKNDTIFIRDLVVIYNRAKYGGSQLRREDLALMKSCRAELLAFLQYFKRKSVFIWDRYITRRI